MSKRKLKIVTLGEVMLRLSVPDHGRFVQANQFQAHYAGGEANVAIALAYMGQRATHVTRFPNSDLGKAARNTMANWGVETDSVFFGGDRMGVYFLENGAMQRSSSIIYDRKNSAFATWNGDEIDWGKILDDADWFHWTGITPAISQAAAHFLKRGLEVAQKKGVKVSADINYRKNLFAYGVEPKTILSELMPYVHLLVGGLDQFEAAMGIKATNYEEACGLVKTKYPNVEFIADTDRKILSSSSNILEAFLWNGSEILRSGTYELTHIVDRIGGGDAFMAGLIYGLFHFEEAKAIEFAAASGALKHSIPGDALLCQPAEILDVVNGLQVGKLKR
ncbi:MAG: hypothetical protein RJA52_914 [Bacteroidota bacterium]|jgi:2-dehydro-3-deoxygluconokinase